MICNLNALRNDERGSGVNDKSPIVGDLEIRDEHHLAPYTHGGALFQQSLLVVALTHTHGVCRKLHRRTVKGQRPALTVSTGADAGALTTRALADSTHGAYRAAGDGDVARASLHAAANACSRDAPAVGSDMASSDQDCSS